MTPARLAPDGNQDGVVSVWAILLVFAFMGMLALIVDLGGARLAQLQMQAAVDGAVKEGLRRPGSEADRRAVVRDQVALTFDDDLDLAADVRAFGAGPVPRLSGGFGDANASQLIEGAGVYDPDLQLNLANLRFGDMVRGTFDPTESPTEFNSYFRADFEEDGAGEAFLLRMRRSFDPLGLDDVPDVSSTGPSIPFVFGRGALLTGGDPDAGYSPRHDGLSARATAIAETTERGTGGTRLKFAGLPVPLAGLAGRTAWTLRREAWEAIPLNDPVVIFVQPNGVLVRAGTQVGAIAPLADRLGREVVVTPPVPTIDTGYVPITQEFGGIQRVIGFGLASRILVDAAGDLNAFDVTRLPGGVATGNATAVLDAPGARLVGDLGIASPADLTALMTAHRQFQGALRAPVLVR